MLAGRARGVDPCRRGGARDGGRSWASTRFAAATLNNVGSSRGATGNRDRGAGRDRRGDRASPARPMLHFEQCRAMGNLAAAVLGGRPSPRGLAALGRRGRGGGAVRPVEFRPLVPRHPRRQGATSSGGWDEAIARADAFLREVEAGSPHYLSGQVYAVRAMLRLGRGDADGAVSDASSTRSSSRAARGIRRSSIRRIAMAAHVFWEVGAERARSAVAADEFLAAIQAGRHAGDFSTAFSLVLAWTLAAAGRGEEAAAALERPGGCPLGRRGRRVRPRRLRRGRGAMRWAWAQSLRRLFCDSRPPGPAISPSSSRRSSSTGRSAQSGTCAQAESLIPASA